MANILNLEKTYCESYSDQFKQYNSLLKNLENIEFSDIKNNQISKAILYRIKTYYQYQDKINKLLTRGITPAASEIFTETVLFYLSAYLKSTKIPIIVKSEVFISKDLRIKPDISLWTLSNEFVGFIECKTQLGRDRFDWENKFKERAIKVRKTYPKSLSFLVVMTESNWQGFGNNSEVGKRYFCLLPKKIRNARGIKEVDFNQEVPIINPIEDLFKQIKERTNNERDI